MMLRKEKCAKNMGQNMMLASKQSAVSSDQDDSGIFQIEATGKSKKIRFKSQVIRLRACLMKNWNCQRYGTKSDVD